MKKQIIALAGIALIMTNCNKEIKNEETQTLDSITSKTNTIELEDSLNLKVEEKIAEEELKFKIKNQDFESYIKSLGTISLPLEFKDEIENNFPEYSKNYDKKQFKKFKSQSSDLPIGVYKIGLKYIAILEIANSMAIVPILNTYDENGKIISSKFIYEFGESEPGFRIDNKVKITEEKITNTQTLTTFEVDEETYETIPGSEKSKKSITEITIDENGKIITKK